MTLRIYSMIAIYVMSSEICNSRSVACSREHKGLRVDCVEAVTSSWEHKGPRVDGVEAVVCGREHSGQRLDGVQAVTCSGEKIQRSQAWRCGGCYPWLGAERSGLNRLAAVTCGRRQKDSYLTMWRLSSVAESRIKSNKIGGEEFVTGCWEHKGPWLDGVEAISPNADVIAPRFQFKGTGFQDCDGICIAIPTIDREQPSKCIFNTNYFMVRCEKRRQIM